MTGHDFHVEADLGDERGELILYRVARFQSFSTSDEEVRAHVEARVDHWRSVFGVDAEPEDLGDVISFLSPDAGLEVFIPSDSVWWTDRHAAFGEDPALGDDLPGEDEAADLAFGYLSELGLGHDGLYLDAVTHNETGTAGSPEDEGELYPSGLTVSYRYQLDDVPVFGPGAKIRVSYANREVCELGRFWRHEEPGDPVAVIPPDEAVSRLGADDRFAALGDGGMSGVITRFELGYYAAGPRFFQRFLVPVYKAEGRIEGGALDDDRFRVYVTAVDGDADQVKEAGVRARSSYREVFTGF